MSMVTKVAKVALTAIALKKLAQLAKQGKHPTHNDALEAAIHTAHAASGADDPDDDESASDDDGDTNAREKLGFSRTNDKFDAKGNSGAAVRNAHANTDAAGEDLPAAKRGGKANPLRAWAGSPGGRNAPRAQRRG